MCKNKANMKVVVVKVSAPLPKHAKAHILNEFWMYIHHSNVCLELARIKRYSPFKIKQNTTYSFEIENWIPLFTLFITTQAIYPCILRSISVVIFESINWSLHELYKTLKRFLMPLSHTQMCYWSVSFQISWLYLFESFAVQL